MNRNVIIVLAGGFLIAILVAMMVNLALSGSKKTEPSEVKKIEILVAAQDLPVGKELKEGDLKWQDWPEDTMFMGAIIRDGQQQPSDAITGKLLRSLSKGQPVHANILIKENQGDFLSANIKKGMRAVSVEVKDYVVADRLFKPGDHVDVIVTYRVRVNTKNNPDAQALVNRYATETVSENIRIMAIDTEDTKAVDEAESGKSKKKKGASKATVTLEVTPQAAEKIFLADKMGNIGFALRSLGDQDPSKDNKSTTDVGISQVMTTLANMRSGGTSGVVRIYDGNQMREERGRGTEIIQQGVDFSMEGRSYDAEDAPSQIIINPSGIGVELE